jgi:acetyl/propionyl-CoA carboxylase alpha subunit
MFSKILVANRGEIANRIIKTLQKLKIQAVAVYDEREKNAQYARLADISVSLGTGPFKDTFLNINKLITIAKDNGCDAIHPGYGFLAENSEFARRCELNDIVFIGPRPSTIASMGDKLESTKIAQSAGVPVIPQIKGSSKEILQNITSEYFPCLVKASAGGGGKGMRKAERREELEEYLHKTSNEAKKYFGNGEVYIEKYLDNPRHIEIQILADSKGNSVHLFERECSVQRRFQKIIEEAPATGLTSTQKEMLYEDAIKLSKMVGYKGAGTVEFLVDASGNHFFLEMNTRIQVEHGITELITGVDIVEEQIGIAAGESISKKALQASVKGHAIEVRLYAEDPSDGFKPSPGRIKLLQFPEGKNIRIDTDSDDESEVLTDFDPLMAKMMAYGTDRNRAINKLIELIGRTVVHGVKNNLAFAFNILNESDFRNASVSTHYIENHPELLHAESSISLTDRNALLAAGIFISIFRYPIERQQSTIISTQEFWRLIKTLTVSLNNTSYSVNLESVSSMDLLLKIYDEQVEVRIIEEEEKYLDLVISGNEKRVFFSWDKEKLTISLSIDYREFIFHRKDFLSREDLSGKRAESLLKNASEIIAPLSGKVIKVNVDLNEMAHEGDTLLVIESMKMENEVKLPSAAQIKQLFVAPGQMVNEGDVLVSVQGNS